MLYFDASAPGRAFSMRCVVIGYFAKLRCHGVAYLGTSAGLRGDLGASYHGCALSVHCAVTGAGRRAVCAGHAMRISGHQLRKYTISVGIIGTATRSTGVAAA